MSCRDVWVFYSFTVGADPDLCRVIKSQAAVCFNWSSDCAGHQNYLFVISLNKNIMAFFLSLSLSLSHWEVGRNDLMDQSSATHQTRLSKCQVHLVTRVMSLVFYVMSVVTRVMSHVFYVMSLMTVIGQWSIYFELMRNTPDCTCLSCGPEQHSPLNEWVNHWQKNSKIYFRRTNIKIELWQHSVINLLMILIKFERFSDYKNIQFGIWITLFRCSDDLGSGPVLLNIEGDRKCRIWRFENKEKINSLLE